MTIVGATGVITYPSAVAGNYAIEVQVSDGRGGLATQRFQLRVGAGSAVASQYSLAAPSDWTGRQFVCLSLNAVDPRQSALTTHYDRPSGMTIDPSPPVV